MKKIAVVGSSNTDLVVRLSRLPIAGETMLGGKFSVHLGGKGANQAVAAVRAGGEVFFLCRMGLDDFGNKAFAFLEKEGIDISGVIRSKKAPSGVALISVAESGENSIAVAPGANALLSPSDVTKFKSKIESAGVLLLQLETPLDTVYEAAKIAQNNGVLVILNPAPAAKLPIGLIKNIDYMTPNLGEAELLSGRAINSKEDAMAAARDILLKGVGRGVLVTMGSKGVVYAGHDGLFYQHPYKVKAVDTTAAGDTFNGAFAVALAKYMNINEAVQYASAAAALSVTKFGAQESAPTAKKIFLFTKKNGFSVSELII